MVVKKKTIKNQILIDKNHLLHILADKGRYLVSDTLSRRLSLEKLGKIQFDALIIGGGATGAGTALDSALRGLNVALIEKRDFSSGTSSRSTKLIHGGVRYLGQFHFTLIREALEERKRLLLNIPYLVKPLKFILPTYNIFEKPYYNLGLSMYDILAGDSGLPFHKMIGRDEAIKEIPSIKIEHLKGGISYYDAQFNDSRLNVLLARCAAIEGATIANRVELISLIKENGKITGAIAKDLISDRMIEIKSKVVVNASGVYIDSIRQMDEPDCEPILSPSQGIHLVFSKDKVQCNAAMIIPKTSDGRVVFIIPWEDYVIMGTTDTPVEKITEEPLPVRNEIDFLLKTGKEYLSTPLSKGDILSVFIGLRPLISLSGSKNTKNISREEIILISKSGLITMGGGKWSTYRKMAEDLTDTMIKDARLVPRNACSTYSYNYPGRDGYSDNLHQTISRAYNVSIPVATRLKNYYGGEAFDILGKKPKEINKNSGYFAEEVFHFIQNEFALSIMDVISRRFRITFLNLNLAREFVKPISDLMSKELKWTSSKKATEEKEAYELIDSLSKSI